MKKNQIQAGPIIIQVPDENQRYFSVFHDLAELTGDEFQREAVKKLRNTLGAVKPKPVIDYEADNISIRTSNAETLMAVISSIEKLATDDVRSSFQQIDKEQLKNDLLYAIKNRPKPVFWQTGDVFAIPLRNDTFAFGQVLNEKYCTCALFDLRAEHGLLTEEQFKGLRVVSILHLCNGDALNNGQWKVLFNQPVLLDPDSGSGGRFGEAGARSYGQCGVMTDLANAYWGLEPWNVMFRETYYDELLMKGVPRPGTANVLNEEDRKTYRKINFGID